MDRDPLAQTRPLGRVLAALAALVGIVGLGMVVAAGGGRAAGSHPGLGDCPVFPDPPASLSPRAPSLPSQAAWNQDVSKAPRDPRSTAYIARLAAGGARLHPDFGSPRAYGIPFAVVGPGQPKLPVNYTAYGEESDPGPFPIPAGAPVEGGAGSDGDRHVLTVDTGSCTLVELYRAFFKPTPKPHWNADSGAAWDLRSSALRPRGWTSADAAGLPIFPGLVRYEEAAAGRVEHAIRVTFASTRDAYLLPATHCAGDTGDRAAPPMGLRLRLKAGYGLGRFSGPARAIALALKRYGLIVADNGSNWFLGGSSDRRWDDENLNQLKTIPGRAFEVVKSAARPRSC